MARLAWFSPMPPARSGVAVCSADLLPFLRDSHHIDVFVDDALAGVSPHSHSAHDFIWRHRLAPYDLTVYQLGNSSAHDYLWPYLFRFPGVAVLHDPSLHHARAAALLRRGRADLYREEFAANHPDLDPQLAEVAVAGFDATLYYSWPMTRLVALASRAVAVHTRAAAAAVQREAPGAPVHVIRLGHGVALSGPDRQAARLRARSRLGIPDTAMLFGCFGGLTPEKRVAQVLAAFAATLTYAPSARLLLGGAASDEAALRAEIRRLGLGSRVVVTGYLEVDALTDDMAACDAALNLRWPTAGEVSGPWLRCLALGLPTVIVDLAHLAAVPSLDPRTWQPHRSGNSGAPPVCIAIDILDEDHSLALAMRRLATQPALREQLGRAAADYWQREHTPGSMAHDYQALLGMALDVPVPAAALPPHLRDDGRALLDRITGHLGVPLLLR